MRYEADFRYSLIHVRDHAESIAFYQGEGPEASQFGSRFRSVLGNFSLLIGWQRNLSLFTTTYSYLPVVLPFLVLFGPYFAGKIEYGDMVQANQSTLSRLTTSTGAMDLRMTRSETEPRSMSARLERPWEPMTMMEGASFFSTSRITFHG